MSEIRYMISETAKQVDVEAHVLRYWEEELSLPIDRNEMGHRYYTEDDITLFKNIKELKEQGFQLKAIKMLLPEIRRNGRLDMDKLLKQREALNQAVEEEETHDVQAASKAIAGSKMQSVQKMQAARNTQITQNAQMVENDLQKNVAGERKNSSGSVENLPSNKGKSGQQRSGSGNGIIGTDQTHHDGKSFIGKVGDQLASVGQAGEMPMAQASAPKGEQGSLMRQGTENAVTVPTAPAEGDRMQQFQMILGNIVLKALQENNRELSRSVSDQVSDQVSDNVLKEMDYLMRVREEREDERFKKLDETIRLTQRSRKEAAAARVEARRLKKLEKKEKKKGRLGLFAKR